MKISIIIIFLSGSTTSILWQSISAKVALYQIWLKDLSGSGNFYDVYRYFVIVFSLKKAGTFI